MRPQSPDASVSHCGWRDGTLTAVWVSDRSIPSRRTAALIPEARRADWYARGLVGHLPPSGGAGAREINEIPAGRQSTRESISWAAGMTPEVRAPDIRNPFRIDCGRNLFPLSAAPTSKCALTAGVSFVPIGVRLRRSARAGFRFPIPRRGCNRNAYDDAGVASGASSTSRSDSRRQSRGSPGRSCSLAPPRR